MNSPTFKIRKCCFSPKMACKFCNQRDLFMDFFNNASALEPMQFANLLCTKKCSLLNGQQGKDEDPTFH